MAVKKKIAGLGRRWAPAVERCARELLFGRLWMPAAVLPFVAGFLLSFHEPSFSICPVMNLFHIPCPTCGLTRAFIHLSRLEIPQAMALHPLSPLAALLLLLFAGVRLSPAGIRVRLFRRLLAHQPLVIAASAAILALFVCFDAVRIIDGRLHFLGLPSLASERTILSALRDAFGLQ
jgi:hypothetical protein